VLGTRERTDLLRGTLDLLILHTLQGEPRHGVAIADTIAQRTGGTFTVPAGSLFPALHRLERDGYTVGGWATTSDGRRVKTYALTTSGRRQLAAEKRHWTKLETAMRQALSEA